MTPGGPAGARPFVALLLVLLVAVVGPAGGAHSSSAFAATSQIDPDRVLLDVSLQPDGDANWEIRYRVRLDDDNTTEAFESLERDVAENRSAFESRFGERIAGTVSAAENATDREMTVRNVSVRTTRQEIPQRYGVLIYSFEWTGFATTDGSRILAGDAIAGLFLDDATSLTVHWPSEYRSLSLDPEPDESSDSSATWRGPTDFTTDQPRLVVSSEVDSGTGTDPGGSESGVSTMATTAVVLLALLVFGTAAWWWRRGSGGDGGPETPPAEAEPPEELLSNEERVLRLLRERGGRMKQQQVVETLGWTDAKTSQVVGALRESGEIEAFRLGRENVLSLPEEDESTET